MHSKYMESLGMEELEALVLKAFYPIFYPYPKHELGEWLMGKMYELQEFAGIESNYLFLQQRIDKLRQWIKEVSKVANEITRKRISNWDDSDALPLLDIMENEGEVYIDSDNDSVVECSYYFSENTMPSFDGWIYDELYSQEMEYRFTLWIDSIPATAFRDIHHINSKFIDWQTKPIIESKHSILGKSSFKYTLENGSYDAWKSKYGIWHDGQNTLYSYDYIMACGSYDYLFTQWKKRTQINDDKDFIHTSI